MDPIDWLGFVGPQWNDWGETEQQRKLNGITVARFRSDWAKLGPDDNLVVNLSSEGGYTDVGVSVMNLVRIESARRRLINENFKSIVNVIGTAYSAASIICMGFDEVVMHLGSEMMIHQASTFAWGNAKEIKQTLTMLESIDESITDVYAARTGLSKDAVKSLLEAESFFTAEQAVKMKLATSKAEMSCRVSPPDRPMNWSYDRHISSQLVQRNGVVAFHRVKSEVPQQKPVLPAKASVDMESMLSKMCK